MWLLASSLLTPSFTVAPAWTRLEASLAGAADGYSVREGLVPASAPQKARTAVPHHEVGDGVVFYRDTNAWCPFCERVWLFLLESGIDAEHAFIDLRAKPEWYKEVIPTSQTPSIALNGTPVWESVEIIEALERALESGETSGRSLLPPPGEARERVLAELRVFDKADEGGVRVGGAGYTYMRGAKFGETAPEDGANLPALREEFLEALTALEARLSKTEGPWFEPEYGVLDVCLYAPAT